MFEQPFKNLDDILHKDAGCTSELDYTEQSSWLLSLKYLTLLSRTSRRKLDLEGRENTFILGEEFRWETWAPPQIGEGKFDHKNALTGDDLLDFVCS